MAFVAPGNLGTVPAVLVLVVGEVITEEGNLSLEVSTLNKTDSGNSFMGERYGTYKGIERCTPPPYGAKKAMSVNVILGDNIKKEVRKRKK